MLATKTIIEMKKIIKYLKWKAEFGKRNKRVLKGFKRGSRYDGLFGYIDEMPVFGTVSFAMYLASDSNRKQETEKQIVKDKLTLLSYSSRWAKNSYCNKPGVLEKLINENLTDNTCK